MLAAWARVKYPATFAGAIAASAPILGFADDVSTDSNYDFNSYAIPFDHRQYRLTGLAGTGEL
jgi:hypothetical protein